MEEKSTGPTRERVVNALDLYKPMSWQEILNRIGDVSIAAATKVGTILKELVRNGLARSCTMSSGSEGFLLTLRGAQERLRTRRQGSALRAIK